MYPKTPSVAVSLRIHGGMTIRVAVFWVVMSCSGVVGYWRFGRPWGGILLQYYTTSQPRKLRL